METMKPGVQKPLDGVVEDEGLLDRMQVDGSSDTFDGGDAGPVFDPLHPGGAGADQLAVRDHVTCAALAVAATDLDTGQVKLFTQNIGQERFLVDDQRAFNTVDVKHLLDHTFPPFVEYNRLRCPIKMDNVLY